MYALKGDGSFTVFASNNNQAFLDIDSSSKSMDTLVDVLQYHVVAGQKLLSLDLSNGQMLTMLNGDVTMIDLTDQGMINDASFVTVDLEGTNGVIHIIDKVLIPPAGEKDFGTGDNGFAPLGP